jgi:hypothetical protein
MKIERGTTRIVIIIPFLGIVIKIARINLLQGFHCLFIFPLKCAIKNRSFKKVPPYFFRQLIVFDSRVLYSFRNLLFRGTNANWQEFWFYLKTRHILLQPTYFSFFGLFNIQKIAFRPLITKSDCDLQFHAITPKARGHHFENANNFCLDKDNKLKFLDYGDKEVREVVISAGDIIYQEFDPDWDYEEYKKSQVDQ